MFRVWFERSVLLFDDSNLTSALLTPLMLPSITQREAVAHMSTTPKGRL